MNLVNKIGKTVKFGARRGLLILKKYAPEILVGTGIVSGLAGAVIAVNNTPKLLPALHRFSKDLKKQQQKEEGVDYFNYPPEERIKDKWRVLQPALIEIADAYTIPVALGVVSVGSILAAHGMMRQRYAALSVAYAAVERSYSAYRDRVRNEVGEEVEKRIRDGLQDVTISYKENGEDQTVVVSVKDPNAHSPYCVWFDDSSTQWQKTAEYNLLFLQAQQNWANDLLHARGHLFLNEVYDMLGVKRSQAGQHVGWVISKTGDNYVDFGLYDITSDAARAFINGWEKYVLLDFNVDGVIYDKI